MGTEFLDKWFSIPKISQYFRTRSPVTMVDIDGWHVRDIIAPLFFNDNMELHNLMCKRLILPYLTGSFHPSFIEEYAVGLLVTLQKQNGGTPPSCVGRSGVAVSPASQLTLRLSEMRRLSFLLLLMITLFKQQVSEMVPRIARRSSRFSMIALIPLILMTLK